MNRYWMGFIGGVFGGIVYLTLEQWAFANGISRMSMAAIMDKLFSPGFYWGIHVLVTGLVGLLAAALVPRKYYRFFGVVGLGIGLLLFGAMNVLFALVGLPLVWALGTGSLLTELAIHLILGWIIAYSLFQSIVANVERSGNKK